METRIARLCWNTNDWIYPSGREGKSKFKSHEKNYGYGHEEWLFDMSKNYKAFHYGFLQPINRNYDSYIGSKYNILFYTVDGITNQKYWIGRLNDVEVISREESKEVYNYFKMKGWIAQQKKDLTDLNLWKPEISEFWNNPNTHFNIKFPIENFKGFFKEPIPFTNNHFRRYTLYHYKNFGIKQINLSGFDPNSGSSTIGKSNKGKVKKHINTDVEIPSKHSAILNGFMNYLQKQYKNQSIRRECKAYGNSKIDLIREAENRYIFYEVKAYNRLNTSLRVAIGQLLEYNCYPDCRNAYKMYLVSDLPPDANFKKYIKHLNTIISIPIGYIQFDVRKRQIIEKIE